MKRILKKSYKKSGIITITKQFLFAIGLIFSGSIYAECQSQSTLDLNAGDVVSADLLNDILGQIEGVTEGMTPNELNGVWSCKSYNRNSGSELVNGYTNDSDGIGSSMSQDITFTKQSNDTFIITYKNNLGQNSMQTTTNTCSGKLISGALFVTNSTGVDGQNCWNTGLYGMKKTSNQCFVWEVTNSFPLASATSCEKKNQAPSSPKDLVLNISSSNISLSWTAPTSLSSASSYEIHRKTTANGTFSSIGTSSSTSFTDANVSSGSNYWYRIFAKNSNGTSTGSNVVKVTYNPAANLNTSNIEIIDFFNGDDSKKAALKRDYTTTNNVMNANLSVGKLDKENLNGLLAGSNGKSPIIKFGLSSFPSAGMSGIATLSTKLIDGNDSSVDAGERVIAANADISWLSDGEKLVLTVPNQSSNVSLNDGDGTTLSGNWAIGGSSDLMTVSSTGLNKPVTLDIKLLEFLSANIAANGPSIGNFFSEGTYFFEMGISGIDLIDSSGNSFSKVQGTFGVDSNPLSIAYIDDVKVQENTGTATVIVSLSSPSINEVKLDYSTSESSATNGQDFTPTSGSLRIAAGDVKGAFTIPLINDAISENNEIFNISFSNILNAELGRNTSSVTIIDNDIST